MESNSSDIIIIGAGPAGLAIAGRLRKKGIDFTILEASDRIASAWHNHYDRLHLHTVKQWSHLPHRPFPEEYPLYVPRQKLVDYFEDYANHFSIKPVFRTKVQSIRKTDDSKWAITSEDKREFIAKQVIISTGVNRVPNEPKFKGQEDFTGPVSYTHLTLPTICSV